MLFEVEIVEEVIRKCKIKAKNQFDAISLVQSGYFLPGTMEEDKKIIKLDAEEVEPEDV